MPRRGRGGADLEGYAPDLRAFFEMGRGERRRAETQRMENGAQQRKVFGVGVCGLGIAVLIAYALWWGLTEFVERPDVWVGIAVTALGLGLAGWTGLRGRDLTERDRRDEFAVTCVLALLAIATFALAAKELPPWFVWVVAVGLVVAAFRFGWPKGDRTNTAHPFRQALRGPVPWRGLTLLGVLLASSSLIYRDVDEQDASQQIRNICEGLKTPPARGCDALAEDVLH